MRYIVQVTEVVEREIEVEAASADAAEAFINEWIENDAEGLGDERGDWRRQAVRKQVHDWYFRAPWEVG